MNRIAFRPAVVAAGLVVLAAVAGRATLAADAGVPLGPNGLGLTYHPMPGWFKFQPPEVVRGWIDTNDTKSMTEHAWELWAGMTEPVRQQAGTFPIFETWVDEGTVFSPPRKAEALAAAEPGRPFRLPTQLVRQRRARVAQATPPVSPIGLRVVSVKYTKEIYDHVQANGYYKTSVMNALNQGWGNTPLADRVVKPFPRPSIMLKPTYQLVSGTAPTTLPYWTGPANSTNPSAPGVVGPDGKTTWTAKMVVVPPGVTATPADGLPVVPLENFYAIKLNATEAAYINGLGQGTVKPGDYAVLVAMHISSREIDNWTWQTFWWSFDKPKIPADVRRRVRAPFDHYDAAVGYSFTTGPDSPAGLNVVCYNPYLEADFDNATFAKPGQLGIESNCMSCHRAATWPPPSLSNNAAYYTGNGLLRPDDPYFRGTTKVDFIWGFADDVPPPGGNN